MKENRKFCLPFYKYVLYELKLYRYKKGVKKRKKILVALSVEAGFENDRPKQLRQLAREDLVVVTRLEPENSVHNDSYHLLRDAETCITATALRIDYATSRNTSVWI